MPRARRTAVLTQAEVQPGRAAIWDKLASGELAFDFTPPPANPQVPSAETDTEHGGVKEAILRWLDEQL